MKWLFDRIWKNTFEKMKRLSGYIKKENSMPLI